VLDIVAELDPSKIIAKLKYHLLAHLHEDIVWFGPLVGVATEIFESFNVIFRYCSILSNHMAPSCDIAHQLSEQEMVKYIPLVSTTFMIKYRQVPAQLFGHCLVLL